MLPPDLEAVSGLDGTMEEQLGDQRYKTTFFVLSKEFFYVFPFFLVKEIEEKKGSAPVCYLHVDSSSTAVFETVFSFMWVIHDGFQTPRLDLKKLLLIQFTDRNNAQGSVSFAEPKVSLEPVLLQTSGQKACCYGDKITESFDNLAVVRVGRENSGRGAVGQFQLLGKFTQIESEFVQLSELYVFSCFIEYHHYGTVKVRLDLNQESKYTLLTASCDAHILENWHEFLEFLPSVMLPVTGTKLGLPDESEEISEGSIYTEADVILVLGTPELEATLQLESRQRRVRGHNPLPHLAHTGFDAAQDTFGFLDCWRALLGHIQPLIHQYPHVLLNWAALDPFIPEAVLVLGVASAQVQDLTLSY
ncbi:hypothetical protein DUI87_07671 [Hirundo rustica rustica]|uniref:Uncharacterized protein n=1 Tax=Hirundo rustica rustica TaxID=333673 RepID=A0A3M0KQD1_HIRRU|nr:hypothetical protein DUI87_07671 [Hirundo rustica rustica]